VPRALPVTTFGPAWSRALCLGAARLSALGSPVLPEWVCAMICLESAGTWDPEILQGHAKLVPPTGSDDHRDEVAGRFGLRLSHGTGARGLLQHMPARSRRVGQPDLISLYAPSDPITQLTDGISSWVTQAVGGRWTYRSLEALYCANLAPARLVGGTYDDETVLYSQHPDDAGTACYWPAGYRSNATPFGLDPRDPAGRLRMRHLSVGLDAAVKACRARYDAEVASAYAANVRTPDVQ